MVDPYDTTAIADGIYEVLNDSELAAELVRKGYQRVAQFSWEKCARETLDVIASVARTTGQATGASLPRRDPG